MDDLEIEGRRLLVKNKIFRLIYDKTTFLIFPENQNFHLQHGNMQEKMCSTQSNKI